eukprot:scaffold262352_cov19-Tisochrysis_lutea.AAC.1
MKAHAAGLPSCCNTERQICLYAAIKAHATDLLSCCNETYAAVLVAVCRQQLTTLRKHLQPQLPRRLATLAGGAANRSTVPSTSTKCPP